MCSSDLLNRVHLLDALVARGDPLQSFETYVKRLEGLERIASSYKGVEKVYAIQAGREVRVIVMPDDVDDVRMTTMSEEIARRIETELQYPGQIKVVLIRETRAVDFAR